MSAIALALAACALSSLPATAIAAADDDAALSLQADDAAAAPDADALSLDEDVDTDAAADPAAARPSARSADSKLFVEGACGRADQRYGLGSRSIGRASLDWRHGSRWSDAWRSVVSLRLDATRPSDTRIDNPVLSLREAYVGWQGEGAASAIEFGRVNLREGPGYGYNPSDFFRANTLRTITSVNPFTLRENRMGSLMLRGQRLWRDVTLEALVSPKVEGTASPHRLSADLGATNDRTRAQLTLGTRFSDTWSARWLLHDADGESPKFGASTTALLSNAAVGHAEWSWGREPSLADRALGLDGNDHSHHRAALGITYTTAKSLSLTGEVQHNGAALDRAGWRSLARNLASSAAYVGTATALQDNAARDAWLLYAVQRDLFVKNLELTGLVKWNRTDASRMAWVELRYKLQHADLALQMQSNHGDAGSEFGITPVRASAGVLATVYF